MPKPKSTVGNELAHARFRLGKTLEQVSSEAGVSAKTVANIEKGSVEPYGHTLYKLAAVLDLDPASLFETEAAAS